MNALDWLAVISVLLIILFYFLLLITSLAFSDQSSTVEPNTLLNCPAGYCVVDFESGLKSCPGAATDVLKYDPTLAFCSRAEFCDSDTFRFAVQPDQSTNSLGVCAPGDVCQCLNRQQCSANTLTVFQAVAGTAVLGINGTRTTFVQASGDLPLSYTSDNNYCQVPVSYIFRSSPGCSGYLPPTNPTADEVLTSISTCMQAGTACLLGELVFITGDDFNVTAQGLLTTPLSCIAETGLTCSPGQVKLYSPGLGQAQCFFV